MTSSVTCDWLNLEAGMNRLLEGIEPEMDAQVEKAVAKNARKAKKRVSEEAAARWSGITGSRYSGGFSSSVRRAGANSTGEVGNRDVPGLVHLLEKGHNTLAGRRVPGNPHMAPVFDEIAPQFYEDVSLAVEKALEA